MVAGVACSACSSEVEPCVTRDYAVTLGDAVLLTGVGIAACEANFASGWSFDLGRGQVVDEEDSACNPVMLTYSSMPVQTKSDSIVYAAVAPTGYGLAGRIPGDLGLAVDVSGCRGSAGGQLVYSLKYSSLEEARRSGKAEAVIWSITFLPLEESPACTALKERFDAPACVDHYPATLTPR